MLLLAGALVAGLLVRSLALTQVPPGIAHDELHPLMDAASLLFTAEHIPGTLTGIWGSASGEFITGIFSELGSLVLVPAVALSRFQWPEVKLLFVVISALTQLCVFLIARRFWGQRSAVAAAWIWVANPWAVLMGRSVFESAISYLAYLIAILLTMESSPRKIYLSWLFWGLGFFTYFGAKPQLVFLVLAVLAYKKFVQLQPLVTAHILTLLAAGVLSVGYVWYLPKTAAGSRLGETKTDVSGRVDLKRRDSLSSSLGYVFVNKLSENVRLRAETLGELLSVDYLFLSGPAGGTESFTLPDHGPMLPADLVLLAIALIYIVRYRPRQGAAIGLFMAASIVPNLVDVAGRNYILRSGLFFPFLVILLSAAAGWQIKRKMGVYLLAGVYAFFAANFLYTYFFRMPVTKSEGWFLSARILSSYMARGSAQQPINAIVPDPKQVFYEYVFWTNSYRGRDTIAAINHNLAKEVYELGAVRIDRKCVPAQPGTTLIKDTAIDCPPKTGLVVPALKDAGWKYVIDGDVLCRKGNAGAFPTARDLTKLKPERTTDDQFCTTWMTRF